MSPLSVFVDHTSKLVATIFEYKLIIRVKSKKGVSFAFGEWEFSSGRVAIFPIIGPSCRLLSLPNSSK